MRCNLSIHVLRSMIRTQKIKFQQWKMYVFCIFNIKEWKCKDWTTTWYKYSIVCKQRQTNWDIKKQTPSPICKDNQWKGWWEKHRPKIQPEKGFLSFHRHLTVITETQEDSTTLKTYPTTIKPSNQATKGDVRDCLGEKRVYMPLGEWQHMYVHNCQETTRIYVSKHS